MFDLLWAREIQDFFILTELKNLQPMRLLQKKRPRIPSNTNIHVFIVAPTKAYIYPYQDDTNHFSTNMKQHLQHLSKSISPSRPSKGTGTLSFCLSVWLFVACLPRSPFGFHTYSTNHCLPHLLLDDRRPGRTRVIKRFEP